MKIQNLIPYAFCALSLLNNANAKPYKPDVQGNYKAYSAYEIKYKNGKPDLKSKTLRFRAELDDKGNVCEISSYENKRIEHKNKIINKYDEKGLLIGKSYPDVRGNIKFRDAYVYDANLNKIVDTSFVDGNVINQIGSYKYDNNNFLIEETHQVKIDSNQFSKGTTYYKNDKFGNKIEESAIRSSSISVSISSETNLSDSSKSSSGTVSNSSGDYSSVYYKYKYDNNGNIIRDERDGIGGTKIIHEYKYDDDGNVLEEIYFDEKDKPYSKTVYEFMK